MAEMKKYDSERSGENLKKADLKKSEYESNGSIQRSASELFGGRKIKDTSDATKKKARKKKKLAIVADIIVIILMAALVAGVVIGSYWLFRYYSDDYEGINITYTVACPCGEDISPYVSMKNKGIYLDTEDNSIYFGKVVDVQLVSAEDENETNVLLIEIVASVKYRNGEGYSLQDNRIAVGSEYKLRSGDTVVDVTVAELSTNASGGQ
jgi:hypothetical protein